MIPRKFNPHFPIKQFKRYYSQPFTSNSVIQDYSLYLVTDSTIAKQKNHTIEQIVRDGILNGVTCVQYREKNSLISTREHLQQIEKLLRITRPHKIPLIIDDRVDLLLGSNADGVHLGQKDFPCKLAREMIQDKILGVTVSNLDQYREAVYEAKADYVGTDAIFTTSTKLDSDTPKGITWLKEFYELVQKEYKKVPIIAIGGIYAQNMEQILQTGVRNIAVVSAIVGSDDVIHSTRQLRHIMNLKHKNPQEALLKEKIVDAFLNIKERKPLVHHMTNFVVMNQTANATLAIGASPIMAHAKEEVSEMVSLSGSLVLNPGTLDSYWIESMIQAGQKANQLRIPIVFDAVGMGASKFRNESFAKILQQCQLSIVKGNSGEIGVLSGDESVKIKGVDSVQGVTNPQQVAKQMAQQLTQKYNSPTVVAITGPQDIISNGKQVVTVHGDVPQLGAITGSGCIVTALQASFAAVLPQHEMLTAAVGGSVVMKIAGEKAAHSSAHKGMYSFRTELFDAISTISVAELRNRLKLTIN